MDNNQSSQIISNSNNEAQNQIASRDRSETILETQPVSVINTESNQTFELKKWMIICSAGVLAIAVFFLFAKETDVCFLSTCNDYSDSLATNSTSIGNDFLAYAGGAASLIVLTTLVGVPLLPAVAISTGVWFVVQMIH
ncbi:MAG: hypothetical protein ACRC06_05435 [Waterburya sp.]